MPLLLHCDNPGCEVYAEVAGGELPDGWWSLEQETQDGNDVAYVLHDIACVAAFARLHAIQKRADTVDGYVADPRD